jgi:NAD-dependent dihydropyrimidine dehydrogenase PreA subunit
MEKDIYKKIAEKIGSEESTILPELLRMVVDLNEAKVLMAMPGTIEELAERIGKPADDIKRLCEKLYRKGVALKSFRGGSLGYRVIGSLVQFRDATVFYPGIPEGYIDLWQKFSREEWPHIATLEQKRKAKLSDRVIPVEGALKAGGRQIPDPDSLSKIIENAVELSVSKCPCRVIEHKCDKPVEVCIQVNNAAKYVIDRGTGRKISKEEALKILKDCEEKGLVHITNNQKELGRYHYICNCCSCCCQNLTLTISRGLNVYAPSRYQAKIDPELCSNCGTCLDRCYFNAIDEVESNGGKTITRINEKCMGCGLCYVTCPNEAIALVEIRPADFIPDRD